MTDTRAHACSALLGREAQNAACLACRAQDTITCTCPVWWFPEDRREQLRTLPHGLGGILAHHASCAKVAV